jgi:glycosyltransferase involved in cell wall biosynthesis
LSEILYSIIIPTHNREKILPGTIENILKQTHVNWELIIVDDGSTDQTAEVVRPYLSERVHYYSRKNEGKSPARNYGITKAKGTYLSFLDDDDLYHPEFLSTFDQYIVELGSPKAAFFCLECTQTENGKIISERLNQKLYTNPIRLLWENKTGIRRFVIHKSILKEYKFIPDLELNEDFDLAIRILLNYPVHYIPDVLCTYVQHPGQISKIKFQNPTGRYAFQSTQYIKQLIDQNKEELIKNIPERILYDLYNHKVYAYASNAMKNGNLTLWNQLIRKISFKGSPGKTVYYLSSLILRLPLFLIPGK